MLFWLKININPPRKAMIIQNENADSPVTIITLESNVVNTDPTYPHP